MPQEQDELLATLSARHYLYTLFQSLFGNEPSVEQFAAIDIGLIEQAYELALGEGGNSALLTSAITAPTTDPQNLKREYTRLFIGPNKLPASPWESTFTSREQVLFTRSTLEIRNFYRSQGFIPAKYPHVADDHLAIELDFLARLAGRAVEALEAEDVAAAREALEASKEFLDEHLLVWVGQYAQKLVESQKGEFYPVVAQALAEFAAKDATVVSAVLVDGSL